METYFVNEFVTLGMDAYFNNRHEHFFEKHIIECLCGIYGNETILEIFKTKDENKFLEVLSSYGFSSSNYYAFLGHLEDFEKFKKLYLANPSLKTDTAHLVESDIITMFLYKCLVKGVTSEEMSRFENYFLNNFNVIKLHFNSSLDPNKTRELWEKKKKLMTDSVDLVEIKPEFLDGSVYEKYGTTLDDVKKMDYRMVEQLNSYIKSKMLTDSINEVEKNKKFPLSNVVITSGNGFVDALLIASMIITELSIGAIYYFLNL